MRCKAINVKDNRLLVDSAIHVVTNPDNEGRILTGSYIELRNRRKKSVQQPPQDNDSDYLPDFLQ